MDQRRASDYRSHQDAGSNESHLRLGKRVVGNDQQNHLLLPVSQEREFILQINGQESTSKTPPTYLGVKVDRKPTWSPHTMHHAQQNSWENGSDEETGRNKMGSQHENLDPGLHRNCQTPHGVCLQNAWSSTARTNLDQLTKTQNAGLRIITGGMKTIPISEVERKVGLLSLEERREEKFLRQSEKMKRAPFTPFTFQV